MEIIHGSLPNGVTCRKFDVYNDDRGSFAEVWCGHWNLALADMAQLSMVHSKSGVLRGMYMHREHDEYISLISGRAVVGLKDLRVSSNSHGVACLIEVVAARPCCVSFPRGILHGWLFTADSIHFQAVSESYRDYAAHDNLGCRWDDPHLNLPWPERPKLVSERSLKFGSLNQLQDDVAQLESLNPLLNGDWHNQLLPSPKPESHVPDSLAATATK